MKKEVYEFISKKTNDPIVGWRTCLWSGEEFAIFQWDVDMLDAISPTICGKKISLSLPTLCPTMRDLRRQLFKNERFLHQDVCEFTWDATISRFTNRHVYCNKARHDVDKRDQVELPYDSSKSVDDHLLYLMNETIYQDLIGSSSNVTNNAKYVNHASKQSNTYLLSNARDDQNCAYGRFITHCERVFDCTHLSHSKHCYECVWSSWLYNWFYCFNCLDSSDIYFCSDLVGCTYCIFCYGLQHASYCIHNKQVTKDEYESYLEDLDLGSYEKLEQHKQTYNKVCTWAVRQAIHNIWSEWVVGHQCSTSNDIFLWFELQSCNNMRYASTCFESQDLMDISAFGESSFKLYECSQSGKNSSHLIWCNMVGESHHMYYCMESKYCTHCFGCVNLYRKNYCIFNVQYSKEEYEKLLPTLIEEYVLENKWWEFFHLSLSPFPYNDTPAVDMYPPKIVINAAWEEHIFDEQWVWTITLDSDEEISSWTLSLWWEVAIPITWRTVRKDINIPTSMETISASELPDHINETTGQDLSKKAIVDKDGNKWRYIAMELEFYKKHGLALPRKHPNKRHIDRENLIPNKELFLRTCDKTWEEILSVYPQDVEFDVYSEEAYKNEIYW